MSVCLLFAPRLSFLFVFQQAQLTWRSLSAKNYCHITHIGEWHDVILPMQHIWLRKFRTRERNNIIILNDKVALLGVSPRTHETDAHGMWSILCQFNAIRRHIFSRMLLSRGRVCIPLWRSLQSLPDRIDFDLFNGLSIVCASNGFIFMFWNSNGFFSITSLSTIQVTLYTSCENLHDVCMHVSIGLGVPWSD